MFVAAIAKATGFTRGIHTIVRFHGSKAVVPSAATLFFVNGDGWALTCKHVAEQVIAAETLLPRYRDFQTQRSALKGVKRERQLLRELERRFGFVDGVALEAYNNFIDRIEGPLKADVKLHPDLDIALLHFSGYTKLSSSTFPIFAKDDGDLKQGKYLCRLGYPFPEFTNFEYDGANDCIRWTNSGRIDTPSFPIEGMVTRHLINASGAVVGFEMSTPGLRGQSGGPAFDADARVWGMQFSTRHLDLDFDVDMEVLRKGQKRIIKHNAVLHVGHCVHVAALKAFMRANGVPFKDG